MATNNGSELVVTPGPGGVVRQGFEGTELEVRDPAAVAIAERERSTIQAMFLMAQRRPRDWDHVRVKLLKDSARWGFADAAIWELPRGGKTLSGPSIRFAEAALRAMGNVWIDVQVTLDTRETRKVSIVVIDLENMLRFSREVSIDKTVERKKLPQGFDARDVIATRVNSYGDRLYIIPATEDEMLQRQQVQVSKVIRTEGLRLLPADILEEVMAACEATFSRGIKEDPEKHKKQLADGFAKLNILPADLAEYLGHPLAQTSPAELQALRGVYQAISQGETTWSAVVAKKQAALEANTKAPDAKPTAPAATLTTAGAKVVDTKPTEAPPHNRQTGEVIEAAPPGGGPDEAADVLIALIDAAEAAGDLGKLKELAPQAQALPSDLQEKVNARYAAAKKSIAAKKGGA